MARDTPIERILWAYETTRGLVLSAPQGAVLVAVAVRDGNGRGCFQSQVNMALDLGYTARTVLDALRQLAKRGLLNMVKQPGRTDIYYLTPEGGSDGKEVPTDGKEVPGWGERGSGVPRKEVPMGGKEVPVTPEGGSDKRNLTELKPNSQLSVNVGEGESKDKSSGNGTEPRWFRDQNFQNRAEAGTLTEEYIAMGLHETIRYINEQEVEAWRNR